MQTVTIDEVLNISDQDTGKKPPLEHYFSPTKKEAFIKEFLHYLNSGLLEAKHGSMDRVLYLAFILSFQFTAPLLEITAEKELVLFYRILQKTYNVEEIDLNLHFGMEQYEGVMAEEKEALEAFGRELDDYFGDSRGVKASVQKRVRKDAINSILAWQREQNLPVLAEAFGRSIVIPSFFLCKDNRLVQFYRKTTGGITYRVAVPDTIL